MLTQEELAALRKAGLGDVADRLERDQLKAAANAQRAKKYGTFRGVSQSYSGFQRRQRRTLRLSRDLAPVARCAQRGTSRERRPATRRTTRTCASRGDPPEAEPPKGGPLADKRGRP